MSSTVKFLCGAVTALALSGCAHSRVDASWGEGIGYTLTAQIGSPAMHGPTGLDAPTAERVADRYYRGQETQRTREAPKIMIAPGQ